MTVDEAKALQKKIMDARTALNDAIFEGKQVGVYTELEIRQIEISRLGDHRVTYDMIDARCFVDPTKLS